MARFAVASGSLDGSGLLGWVLRAAALLGAALAGLTVGWSTGGVRTHALLLAANVTLGGRLSQSLLGSGANGSGALAALGGGVAAEPCPVCAELDFTKQPKLTVTVYGSMRSHPKEKPAGANCIDMQEGGSIHPALSLNMYGTMRAAAAALNFTLYYNPSCPPEKTDVIYILSGPGYGPQYHGNTSALDWALEMKRRGKTQLVYAGPLIAFWKIPREIYMQVDYWIGAGSWVSASWSHYTHIANASWRTWGMGINVDEWAPAKTIKERQAGRKCVLYDKMYEGGAGPAEEIKKWLSARNFNVTHLKYGHYSYEQYKRALNESVFMVFLVPSETQGAAMIEAWSMDVPTFVWSGAMGIHGWEGIDWFSSSAPYLTPQTGALFGATPRLEPLIATVMRPTVGYRPRQWVIENMSYESAGLRIYRDMVLDVAAKHAGRKRP